MPPKNKKSTKKLIKKNSTTTDSEIEDIIDNSDSDQNLNTDNIEDDNIEDDNIEDDNIEDDNIEDDNENDNEDDGDYDNDEINTQTEDGNDKCLYKFSKNKLNDIISDDDDDNFMDDIETENAGNELLLENDDRITDPVMTKYEYVRIIGNRAKQIAMGSKKFIKNADNMSSKDIAILELEHKMIPYKIKRPLPNNRYEIWKISELYIPDMINKSR